MLLSCDGYGTDTIIYLKALSDEANELLPVFNKTSTRYYRTIIPTGDWSGSSSHNNFSSLKPQIDKLDK